MANDIVEVSSRRLFAFFPILPVMVMTKIGNLTALYSVNYVPRGYKRTVLMVDQLPRIERRDSIW